MKTRQAERTREREKEGKMDQDEKLRMLRLRTVATLAAMMARSKAHAKRTPDEIADRAFELACRWPRDISRSELDLLLAAGELQRV